MDGTPFLVAGYAVTWGALVWYLWRLDRSSRRTRRALEALEHRSATEEGR